MRATAEIQVVPVGVGVSVRKWIQRVHEVLVEGDSSPSFIRTGPT